jgi:hypothetical protein
MLGVKQANNIYRTQIERVKTIMRINAYNNDQADKRDKIPAQLLP